MQLVRSGAAGSAALELAVSHALLTRVAAGEVPPTLRVYRPGPTVAFGKLDTLRPGYAAAAAAAREHGYEPVLRLPGGHAAAYHGQSLGIDVVYALDDPVVGTHDRFRSEGERLAGALARARRRRARGGGAGRVLPGRLQRQRARAREADRHRAAARARRRRCSARRSSSATARGSGPSCATSTPRSSSSGTTRPPAQSTRRSQASPSTRSSAPSSPPTATLEPAELDEETLALAHRLEPQRRLST